MVKEFFIKGVEGVASRIQDSTPDPLKQRRLSDQCYLLANYDDIQKDILARREKFAEKAIKNFSMTMGDPSEILNVLAPKQIQPFLDLTPAQKSILQPYIRLFKVTKEGLKTKKSEEFLFNIASSAQDKIIYGDGDSKIIKSSIDYITTSGLGRIPEVGIKGFSFEKTGGNEQAHVPNTIIAKLNLFVTNLDAILLNYKELDAEGRFVYPFGRTAQNPTPPPILDLLSYTDKIKAGVYDNCLSSNDNNIDNTRTEIHIHVGYSVPSNAQTLYDFKLNEFQLFKEAVERSRVNLVLLLKTSNIRLNKDGTISLEMTYNAMVEGILENQSLGVFNVGSNTDFKFNTLFAKQQRKAILEDSQGEFKSSLAQDQERILTGSSQQLDVIEALCNEIKKDPNSPASAKYRKTIDNLKNKIRQNLSSQNSENERAVRINEQTKLLRLLKEQDKIYHIDVSNKGLESYKTFSRDLINDLNIENKKKQEILSKYGFNEPDFNSKSISTGKNSSKNLETLIQELSELSEENDKEDRNKSIEEISETFLKNSSKEVGDGIRRISWIYLGDLMDIILDNFYKKAPELKNNIRFIMGPMKSPQPSGNTTEKLYNLADLPISLSLFIKWWTKNVVQPERTTYSLKAFIKDILADIIAPATGGRCFDLDTNSTVQGNYFIFNAPEDFDLGVGKIHSVDVIKQLAERRSQEHSLPDPSTTISYIYIYAYSAEHHSRIVDVEVDAENGIYHLSYGLNRGLVKDMEFKRVESSGRREALMEQTVGNNIAQHQERYNCVITMEGNGIFEPGMTVYLNPYIGTISKRISPIKLTSILGMGGYYYISKIESNFSSNGEFETIVNCIWTAPGFESIGVSTTTTSFTSPEESVIKK